MPLNFDERPVDVMRARAEAFARLMHERRSVRVFSDRSVPRELIEQAIATAGSAPSGAHRQPWHFAAVQDPNLKREIRQAAEAEEHESYTRRMPEEWLRALAPIGTDWHKPYLEIVPWLVVCFAKTVDDDGAKNYYVQESCGIACGLFIAALHNMGLVTLTHTPSPMRFLARILGRPKNERPYIQFPVGYPAAEATVPDLERKPLTSISSWQ